MQSSRFLGPVLLVGALGACALVAPEGAEGGGRGAALYAQHCASCHGVDGGADGPAAPFLHPAPRAFRAGAFHLVSTDNGNPSDADLVRVIRHGMPGSAMPGWGWLAEEDLRDLARHVRELAFDGRADELIADAWREGVELEVERAEELAWEEIRPGGEFELGERPADIDAGMIERGRELYTARCASCHGEDGAGSGGGPTWDDDGTPNHPRDFTSGLLRGGSELERLAERILAGIPGTAMGAESFDASKDLWALAAYTRSLIAVDGDGHGRQVRLGLAAERVDAAPSSLDDPAWERAAAIEVPLMPLMWHDEPVRTAGVRALHDGERIALLFEWNDPTADVDPLRSVEPDGLALMWSDHDDPPVFAMGGRSNPVSVWQWKAWWGVEAMGLLDLIEAAPLAHAFDPLGADARPDATPYVPGDEGADSPVRVFRAAGPGLLRTQVEPAGPVALEAVHADGRWRLLVTLSKEDAGRRLALAIWNGSTGDRGARKAITIWHALVLR